MDGFLPKVVLTDPFMVMAQTLAHGLEAKGLLKTVKYSLGGWANEIRLLCASQKEEHVSKCMEWLLANLDDKYTPQVRSARSFRSKFNRIDAARTRQMKFAKPSIDLAVQVLHKRMGLVWPIGTDPEEVMCSMQRSRERYVEFCRLLAEARARQAPGTIAGLMHRVEATLHSSISMIEIWYREVHKIATTWSGWHGDFRQWDWSHDHRWFTKTGEAHALGFAGRVELWNEMLKTVYENHKS